MVREKFDGGEWEPWFAWHPVRLLGTFRIIWLRRVSRRCVFTERNKLKIEYSDTPAEHPAGYGLRRHGINANPSLPITEIRIEYRGYNFEQKTMIVGWQITITKNDAFIRNSSVSEELNAALAEARAYIDDLVAQS